jgi:hypothetical protein
MKSLLLAIMLMTATPILASENIVHDDGTAAQISFYLPTQDNQDGREIKYTKFRIVVVKDDRLYLFADLTGSKTEDGKVFFGKIIIPSGLIDSAEILMLGYPRNSSHGVKKKLKVSTFRKVTRDKSWSDQK